MPGRRGPTRRDSGSSRHSPPPARSAGREVSGYIHGGERRANNPPVGLVTPDTDPDQSSETYAYDPRLDPQLGWSGKRHSEFKVDTVSLHVHERIDPSTILGKVLRKAKQQTMFSFFETPENNPALRHAIEFYQHDQDWSNRLIAGDSLLVMNSLLAKEGMGGRVQMAYFDPPYGIKYGSNFQPFVSKRNVKDGRDGDLTQEPETIRAFRDTWELGVHSYLSHLRDRLLLASQLLSESGSMFVQISDENLHHVREIMDEVFGSRNFVAQIAYRTGGAERSQLANFYDYILWYAKDKSRIKSRKLYEPRTGEQLKPFTHIELPDGTIRPAPKGDMPEGARRFSTLRVVSQHESETRSGTYTLNGREYKPPAGRHWSFSKEGLDKLYQKNRLRVTGGGIRSKVYHDDFPYQSIHSVWNDTGGAVGKRYVVQTSEKVIRRCILMSTDPGDLVLDITCGSGTTAYVAERWGRRWITCDTSRIAVTLARQRLMTARYDYYRLKDPKTGIRSGFLYKTIPKITMESLAYDSPPQTVELYNYPIPDREKARVSGPFTVEAVPSPVVKSMDMLSVEHRSYAQTGSRQQQWRDELLKAGIRGRGRQRIEFSRVEPHPATRWLHADAETKEDRPRRAVVSFGPEHAPLERRQVGNAVMEAQTLVPKPAIVIFAAMQFDPEAAKEIDGLKWPGVAVLKAEMNKDLLTEDLKRSRQTNESFWLVGQPDVEALEAGGEYAVRVRGFDYYNTRTGEVESGGPSRIAMWMLDEDYDGRSVYPQQVFFPMEEESGGWGRLARTLQAQIDEELIAKYGGTESIRFKAGPNGKAAVKITDDRGVESLRIIELGQWSAKSSSS